MAGRRLGRRLERVLLALVALLLAASLTRLILARANEAARLGHAELQRDALLMLWSPLVFAAVGVGFLLRAGWPAGGRRSPLEPSASDAVAVAAVPPSRYLQACGELGVEPGASWTTIRAVWRRRLPHWHPDRGGDPQLWLRRQAAYQLLEAWEDFGEMNRGAR